MDEPGEWFIDPPCAAHLQLGVLQMEIALRNRRSYYYSIGIVLAVIALVFWANTPDENRIWAGLLIIASGVGSGVSIYNTTWRDEWTNARETVFTKKTTKQDLVDIVVHDVLLGTALEDRPILKELAENYLTHGSKHFPDAAIKTGARYLVCNAVIDAIRRIEMREDYRLPSRE